MTHDHGSTDEQALGWVIRLADPGFEDWNAFEAWLAADPAHAGVYQAMAAADADAAALLKAAPAPALAPPGATRPLSRRRWIGGAVAASLALFVGYAVLPTGSAPYTVETAAGARRTVTLADGSRIDLNGGTRVTLDRKQPRFAVLDHGEAAFTVVHDDARPFRVQVGAATLLDVGTVFNVTRDGGVTTVAVAEGAVIYNPDAEAVNLSAGRTLRASDDDSRLVVGEMEAGTIAVWREGRLVYDGAPLEQVAADLSRNLGLTVSAAPEIAARPFRGVIVFGRDQDRLMAGLGPLLGVHVERRAAGWLLAPPAP